ncbi:NADH-quinone oxidoreductase subunit E [bacterium]|nr:NADH-quinone oxidoreductase subunit E [bacterium]
MDELLKTQERVNLIFKEEGIWTALDRALALAPAEIVDRIEDSGLRGRGGAGFPTGRKWAAAASAAGTEKYVICNADEGEPGTFKDREILTRQPDKVLSGMAICARAIGARRGYIYLRGEYAYLRPQLAEHILRFADRLDELGQDFKIDIRLGSGAYVCGEETALIESMEGARGEPRNKPPYPASVGYRNRPTVVNNVETLVYAAMIFDIGPAEFKRLGTRDSAGAKVFCVSGDTPRPGVYELELGMTLARFVGIFGDGHTKVVQVGGCSGFCVPGKAFADTILGFEGVPTGGAMMLFNSSRSMYNVLQNFLEFFANESCGQCVPCRAGCQQLLKGIRAVKAGTVPREYMKELQALAQTMNVASKCGLGQSVANSFMSITTHFTEEMYF